VTARLTKRFKACLSESEMSGGSEGWFVSLEGRGGGLPLWPSNSSPIPPESVSTVAPIRPEFSSRKETGVGARGRDSLDCLLYSCQPGRLRRSPTNNTNMSYIEQAVSG